MALQDPAAAPAFDAPPGGGAFSASGASSSLGGVAGLGASGGASATRADAQGADAEPSELFVVLFARRGGRSLGSTNGPIGGGDAAPGSFAPLLLAPASRLARVKVMHIHIYVYSRISHAYLANHS